MVNQLRFYKALLINPPTGLYRRDGRCQSKVADQTVQIIFPPIEVAQVASVLRDAGVHVHIRDYPAIGASWDHYLSDLKSLQPDMVMVIAVTATAEQDFHALAVAKETLGSEKILTIAKGEFLEVNGEEVMARHDAVDFGLFGEIEEVILSLLRNEPLESLPGLIWRSHGSRIVRNAERPIVNDLDALPLPARDLLDNRLYRSPETGNPLTVIHGNRGCMFKCIFCPAGSMSNYRVRYRQPVKVMEEIDECVVHYGIKEFLFHGDTFTLNKKWLLELCDRIIASGHNIRWGCNSRVDTMDDERASRMKQAGCWVVAFGVESSNQDILDRMKKGQKIGEVERAVAVCKRNALRTHAFYLIGTPWETRETLEETYRFARKLNTDFFDFNIAYPLPGTELFEIIRREGLFEHDDDRDGLESALTHSSYARSAVRTYSLSSRELTQWRKKTLLKLYLRPQYVIRMLGRAGSPGMVVNYLRAGYKRLVQLMFPGS